MDVEDVLTRMSKNKKRILMNKMRFLCSVIGHCVTRITKAYFVLCALVSVLQLPSAQRPYK